MRAGRAVAYDDIARRRLPAFFQVLRASYLPFPYIAEATTNQLLAAIASCPFCAGFCAFEAVHGAAACELKDAVKPSIFTRSRDPV